MKKIIVIIIGALLVGAIALVLIFARPPASTNNGNTGGTGTLPSVSGTVYTAPTGDTITIGTPQGSVALKNFYASAKSISADHTSVVMQDSADYTITYYAPDSSFNILINNTPFDSIRAQAESAFVMMLGVSPSDACKLNVRVGTLASVDPTHSGQNFPLSFCTAGAFQAK
jgi:hypothetical protein